MAKSPYKIPAEATFREAADHALRAQAVELLKNLQGTADGDVESLHDMRVASRRLRAAMSVFAQAYSPKKFRPVERRVAEVTDALGNVRDADVLLEYLEECSRDLPEAEKVGVLALADSVRDIREEDRQILIRDLGRLKRGDFAEDIGELTGGKLEPQEEIANG